MVREYWIGVFAVKFENDDRMLWHVATFDILLADTIGISAPEIITVMGLRPNYSCLLRAQ